MKISGHGVWNWNGAINRVAGDAQQKVARLDFNMTSQQSLTLSTSSAGSSSPSTIALSAPFFTLP